MADVVDAFLRGHQYGQAESDHQQQLEQNKLHTMILKHQIDALKIESQLRTRELAKSNLELMQGQPAADIPSDTVTTPQQNLPSTGLAGVVSGLIRGRNGLNVSPGGPEATPQEPAADAPAFTPAPAAQDTTPGTNDVTTRLARAIQIPGVAGLGVDGVSVRPKSAEDLVQAHIAAAMRDAALKPEKVGPGERVVVNGKTIAEGGPKLIGVPPGGLADASTGAVVTTGPGSTSEFGQFQQAYAEGLGAKSYKDLNAEQKSGVFAAFNKAKQDPTMRALLIAIRQASLDKSLASNAPPDTTPVVTGPPDPATANIPSKVHGLTPNAVHQNGLVFAMTGRMAPQGMGSSPKVKAARDAINNHASALADAAGVDLPTLQSEYKANSAALGKMVPAYRFTAGAAGTANDNIQLALDQSPKVPRTGSPLVNHYLQWANGHTLTGNAQLTKFETYIYTAAREYAKVTSGASQSVAGLSDTAAKEAEKLLNAAQTPEAFAAAAGAMQNDMQNVTKNQIKQIGNVSDTIAKFLSVATGTPAPAGAGIDVTTPAALPRVTLANGQIQVSAPDGSAHFFATKAAADRFETAVKTAAQGAK